MSAQECAVLGSRYAVEGNCSVLAAIDIASVAANDVNEDRAGAAGRLAWVIDGPPT